MKIEIKVVEEAKNGGKNIEKLIYPCVIRSKVDGCVFMATGSMLGIVFTVLISGSRRWNPHGSVVFIGVHELSEYELPCEPFTLTLQND